MADTLSVEEVISYVAHLVSEEGFRKRNERVRQENEWLYREKDADVGTETQVKYRPYDLADDTHAFKNRMLAAPLKIQIGATGPSGRAEDKAQSQENFFRRYYYHWREKVVFDPILFDKAAHGVGYGRLSLNPKALPQFAELEKEADVEKYLKEADDAIKAFIAKPTGDLFLFEHVDIETVYYPPGRECYVYAAEVPLYKLQREYAGRGVEITKKGANYEVVHHGQGVNVNYPVTSWSDSVTLYTLEDDDYCYHVLLNAPTESGPRSGHVVSMYRNYFGRPTFTYTYGERTASKEPHKEFDSLLGGKYTTIPLLAQQVRILMNAGIEAGQMRMTLEQVDPSAPPLEGAVQIEVTEEGTLIPPQGYKLVSPNLSLGVDVTKSIELIQAIDKSGFPTILKNPESVQATSGYDQALQQDSVQSLMTPPLTHFGSMLAEVAQMMFHAVKEIGEEVSVHNLYSKDGTHSVGEVITLKPDAVIDTNIAVTFNSVTLYNRISMIETDRILMQADLQHETGMLTDTLGVDDPEAWRKTRSKDKIRKAMDDRAIADALEVIDGLRGVATDEALMNNGVETMFSMGGDTDVDGAPPLVETNGEAIRDDRGPSYPSGPGGGQPVIPTQAVP